MPTYKAITMIAFAGACSSLVGIGLARFGYSAVVPALIEEHWFTQSEVFYLSSANFVGYLVGALAAPYLSAKASAPVILRMMMFLAAASFAGCAFPTSPFWFFVCRLASGIAGGLLMAVAAPTLLPLVAPKWRGLASGMIFTGIGIGVVIAG